MLNIIAGHSRFRETVYPEHTRLFSSLGEGQHPETLIVSCSDSRVDLNWVTQARPGDIFHVRNAGNLVPPRESGQDAAAAAIQYAVENLPIRDVVVCGHSGCGAMTGALAGIDETANDSVSRWLRYAPRPTEGMSLDDLVRQNVREQLDNLTSYDFVASRVREGSLRLWGWVYQIPTSEILQLDPRTGEFRNLESFSSSLA